MWLLTLVQRAELSRQATTRRRCWRPRSPGFALSRWPIC